MSASARETSNNAMTTLVAVQPKGYVKAGQITADNIDDFAASLDGTVEDGVLTFQVDGWTHRAIPNDWIVLFMPSGDLLVLGNKFFNRIYDASPVG